MTRGNAIWPIADDYALHRYGFTDVITRLDECTPNMFIAVLVSGTRAFVLYISYFEKR
jgi:hypothetical protein